MSIKFSFSIKRLIAALALTVLVVFGALYFDSSPKFIVFVAAMFLCGAFCNFRITAQGKKAYIVYIFYILCMLAAAALSVVIVQKVNDSKFAPSLFKFFLNVQIALIFIAVICAAEALFAKKLHPRSILLSSFLLLVFGLANYFVFIFRGNAISPVDFLTLETAVNFAGNYEYEITRFIYNGITIYLAAAFFLTGINFDVDCRKAVRVVCPALIAVLVCCSLLVFLSKGSVRSHYNSNVGCWTNGLLLNFVLEVQECIVTKPEGYSLQMVSSAEEEYGFEQPVEQTPNIIVIMNESFADLSIFGDLKTDSPILEVFDSLQENTVKGYALSSVFGGMTPNSEFEFITGSSMGLLTPYAVPFQQYILEPVYSLEHYLQSLGYTSYAAHPADIKNWMRYDVYPRLGFDNYSFIEEFSNAETLDGYVSDRALYEHIIEKYNSMDASRKFIYAVTMQNHSPYELANRDSAGLHSEFCSSGEADIYLSRVRESDRALGMLLDHFKTVDEDVVILMFGDHQPTFSSGMPWSDMVNSGDLDDQMPRYTVPFLVWTNYDSEEKQVELTSLNFLSNYLLEAAGLPLSPYNRFLSYVQQSVPAINAYGYYSVSEGRFKTVDEASGAEKAALQEYACLQYNALFDKANRSTVFFPTLIE